MRRAGFRSNRTWWYPLSARSISRLLQRARRAQIRRHSQRKGFDVSVDGVEAYSTLGWFKDPLLNTFSDHDEAELAEILFHELAHQRVFVSGDTDFNEAFATSVGEEGVRRWLEDKKDSAALDHYLGRLRHNRDFVHLVIATRDKLNSFMTGKRPQRKS